MNNYENINNVLIIAASVETNRVILEILARKGVRGTVLADRRKALEILEKDKYSLVFDSITSDMCSDSQGINFELLSKIRSNFPELAVVLIAEDYQNGFTNQAVIDIAVKAIQAGYRDFMTGPPSKDKIVSLIDSVVPAHRVSSIAASDYNGKTLYTIIGKSNRLKQTVSFAERIAPTSVPVLISGESGTGKELLSYLIHNCSKRVDKPYLCINCAALSDSLLESELFGHEKGAFTGAYSQRKGRFEMAHGGTLLLDEITETSLNFQAKLLRVLEQQDFERVGGNENITVNVRIISTTNKDLLEEVRQNRFRADLYYRLSAARLVIPPLRDRREDLNDLIWHFVNSYACETDRIIKELDPAMIEIFSKYSWPGNIRQLRNVIRTSIILGQGPLLSLADVSWLFDEFQPLTQENTVTQHDIADVETDISTGRLGGIRLADVEQQAIIETLNQTSGNQTKAAGLLGISDRTLRGKIKKYRQEGILQTV